MQRISLRAPLLAAFTFSTLLGSVHAQTPNPTDAPDTTGLPTFLGYVPPGSVEVGLTFDQLFDAVCQVANPNAPKDAAKRAAELVVRAMKNSTRILGRKKVDLPGFFLAKWPVKNREYEVYVAARKAANQPVKFPLHWWSQGQKEDLDKRLPEIQKQYPKDKLAFVYFWEANFAELPYALKDEKGNSIEDLPVVYVSYNDANDFAAYLGMRLPTEAEFTRASRGDSKNLWPSATPDGGASYSADLLKQLKISESTTAPQPAGTGSTGPFGHFDLHGQVWQLVAGLGLRPISGKDAFDAEWKQLAKESVGKEKLGVTLKEPEWREDKVIAKGGSYVAATAPIQLLIDSRRAVTAVDTVEGIGFRLAKSLKPGYDLMFSLLQGTYNRNWFGDGQEPDLASQFGAERYELADNGFPKAYHAVSFAPVNFLTSEKRLDLVKLLDASQGQPLLLGTLAVTSAMTEPAAPRGIYSLLYRRAGVPKELNDAVKALHKLLNAKKKPDEKEDDKTLQKKTELRRITQRFGLTDDDVAAPESQNGQVKFVRIEGKQVPIDDDVFLLFGNDGKVAGFVKATAGKPVGAAIPGQLTMEDKGGKTQATIRFTAPLNQEGKKFAEFTLPLLLDLEAPTADKPWRQSQAK